MRGRAVSAARAAAAAKASSRGRRCSQTGARRLPACPARPCSDAPPPGQAHQLGSGRLRFVSDIARHTKRLAAPAEPLCTAATCWISAQRGMWAERGRNAPLDRSTGPEMRALPPLCCSSSASSSSPFATSTAEQAAGAARCWAGAAPREALLLQRSFGPAAPPRITCIHCTGDRAAQVGCRLRKPGGQPGPAPKGGPARWPAAYETVSRGCASSNRLPAGRRGEQGSATYGRGGRRSGPLVPAPLNPRHCCHRLSSMPAPHCRALKKSAAGGLQGN